MQRVLFLLLSGIFSASPAETAAAVSAPHPAPVFRMALAGHYEKVLVRPTALTGEKILHQLCFEAPPGCMAGGNACTIFPEYPGVPWEYQFKLTRQPARGSAHYDIAGAVLGVPAGVTVAPTKTGKSIRWAGLPVGSPERKLVWEYLVKESGAEVARVRLAAIDRMGYEIAWHERQHRRHGAAFSEALQAVYNTPRGFPKALELSAAEDPVSVLEAAVAADREKRVQTLFKNTEICAADFHRSQETAQSFSQIVEQCACFGNAYCQDPLPPFPGEFTCSF